VVSWIVRLLRIASFVICAIVIVSFTVFALDQTKSASNRQTEAISRGSSATASTSTSRGHENTVHRAIDETSEQLTSPFAGVVSGAESEWGSRAVKLLLALAVYGFGLGYLARAIRVRA
jgi:hypothetical protein